MPESQPPIDEIFDQALRRAAGQDRASYLNEVCGGDLELRRRAERLLQAVAEAGSFLEAPAQDPSPTVDSLPIERAGSVIGPYKLLELIGEGGMGTVWMALQTEPVKRLVAVKLIKAGMDSKQIVARFEAERQALALMDHPNIARVLDAGTVGSASGPGSGRPYFVMELVKGVPITTYCDEHHLTPRQRLELFVPICQAVQHAHQKGIIHRDLKPSNVLVALYDGRPVPKVIDFGVAKATGQSLTDWTLVTGFGNIVGTLEYMSPEQAEFNQLDIDTRSDIYSLGALLYELLAGSPPFARRDLSQAGMLEMLRVIREDEPSKPSSKLSTAEGLPTLAAQRGTEPAKLTRLVRGELDWIVMKALEKDRNRRYEAANSFALDVQRFLADEPVSACPPSVGYRLRKFTRRNKLGLSTGVLIAASLLSATLVSNWQVIRAMRAEGLAERRLEAEQKAREETDTQRARAQKNFELAREAVDRYFTKVSESPQLKAQGLETLRRELLTQARDFYERFLEGQGGEASLEAERARTYVRLANIMAEMGDRSGAIRLSGEAKTIFEALRREQPDSSDYRDGLAEALETLGVNCFETRQMAEARSAIEAAIAERERLAHERPTDARGRIRLAATLHSLGRIYRSGFGQENAAVAVLARARELCEGLAREHPREPAFQSELAKNLVYLGRLQFQGERFALAEQALQTASGLWDELVRDHPDVPEYQHQLAGTFALLGTVQLQDGQPRKALVTSEQGVMVFERLARRHPDVPAYREQLANLRILFASALALLGDHRRAASEGGTAVAEVPGYGLGLHNAACLYCVIAAAVGNDAAIAASEREGLAQRHLTRAMELLVQAQSGGTYKEVVLIEGLKKDPYLDPLRPREDFKKLLREVEEKRRPSK